MMSGGCDGIMMSSPLSLSPGPAHAESGQARLWTVCIRGSSISHLLTAAWVWQSGIRGGGSLGGEEAGGAPV